MGDKVTIMIELEEEDVPCVYLLDSSGHINYEFVLLENIPRRWGNGKGGGGFLC